MSQTNVRRVNPSIFTRSARQNISPQALCIFRPQDSHYLIDGSGLISHHERFLSLTKPRDPGEHLIQLRYSPERRLLQLDVKVREQEGISGRLAQIREQLENEVWPTKNGLEAEISKISSDLKELEAKHQENKGGLRAQIQELTDMRFILLKNIGVCERRGQPEISLEDIQQRSRELDGRIYDLTEELEKAEKEYKAKFEELNKNSGEARTKLDAIKAKEVELHEERKRLEYLRQRLDTFLSRAPADKVRKRILRSGKEPHTISPTLTARERIDLIAQPASVERPQGFVEIQGGREPSLIVGVGPVPTPSRPDPTQTYFAAQDFLVGGGVISWAVGDMIRSVQETALRSRRPIVYIFESGGADVKGGIDSLGGCGDIFQGNSKLNGTVPQISLVCGPCAGAAAYSPGLTGIIIMVGSSSYAFLTGPKVVEKVMHVKRTAAELGGPEVHTEKSGLAAFYVPDFFSAAGLVQEILGYLPRHVGELPFRIVPKDSHNRLIDTSMVPADFNKPYDVRELMKQIVDQTDPTGGRFLEFREHFGPTIVTALSRIDGQTVGIVANQPKAQAGAITVEGAEKAAWFIRFCNAFNIPLISLADNSGYLPDPNEEARGIIRQGSKMLDAWAEASVPKITVYIRKGYGGGYLGMNSKTVGGDRVLAWYSSEIAVMGAEPAVEFIHAGKPVEVQRLERDRFTLEKLSPYHGIKVGEIDMVIRPEATRMHIISFLIEYAPQLRNLVARRQDDRIRVGLM